jgi:hypothetical protein
MVLAGDYQMAQAAAKALWPKEKPKVALSWIADELSQEEEDEKRALQLTRRTIEGGRARQDEGAEAAARGAQVQAPSTVREQESAAEDIDPGLAAIQAHSFAMEKSIKLVQWARARGEIGDRDGVIGATAVAKAMTDPKWKAISLSQLAKPLVWVNQLCQANQSLQLAFVTVAPCGRASLFSVLRHGSLPLTSIDQGQTLWRVWEASQEVDS